MAPDVAGVKVSATLAATAGVEPAVLVRNLINYSGDGDDAEQLAQIFTNNGGDQCSAFAENSTGSEGHQPCYTDWVPYQPIALDTTHQILIVTQTNADAVVLLDAADVSAPGTTLAVGTRPVAVAVDGAGRAYVANRGSNTLSVIDLASRSVVDEVTVGNTPVSVQIDTGRAAGPLVYVVSLFGDNLAIYDPDAGSVRWAPACERPGQLTLDIAARRGVLQCKGVTAYQLRQRNGDHGGTVHTTTKTLAFELLE